MSEYTPTTEEIREYIETGGEPRPWVELDEAEKAREKARVAAFDRWLAAHDAEVRASVVPEIGMPCANTKPHPAHAWQMSGTGWCLCAGVVTEEPEWEYGVKFDDLPGRVFDRLPGDPRATHRRRKSGPWVPVKQEGADDDV